MPDELPAITQMGVLVVIAAGNANTTVASPGICSLTVPGVITVGGLRNVGTKVGYSSYGPAVGVSAPAGNCINTTAGSDCLRSIDTTTNDGATSPDPSGNGYTNEQNPNLGTSFATPIVSGIAALMRSVNANLTPALLVSRLKASATAFPANSGNLPVCPMTDPTTEECSCLVAAGTPSQCGSGMVNALAAVQAAQKPIGVISYPASISNGSVFDASGSVAACNLGASPPAPLGIKSYAWSATPTTLISGGASGPQVTVNPGAGGSLTLTVTDTAGNVDTETVVLSASAVVSSSAPTAAGPQSMACPAALAVNPAAPTPPTVTASFFAGDGRAERPVGPDDHVQQRQRLRADRGELQRQSAFRPDGAHRLEREHDLRRLGELRGRRRGARAHQYRRRSEPQQCLYSGQRQLFDHAVGPSRDHRQLCAVGRQQCAVDRPWRRQCRSGNRGAHRRQSQQRRRRGRGLPGMARSADGARGGGRDRTARRTDGLG